MVTASAVRNDVISSEKVEGTSVYNMTGDKLGSIDDLMIDKISGASALCRARVRRVPQDSDRSLSDSLEGTEVFNG